ncbi:MFS transporter [Streptomyces rubradiris]|uniref:MFS transporter n=1 Tax=Streptomyces rubradiris TaxID=285531 RepID=UPI003410B417
MRSPALLGRSMIGLLLCTVSGFIGFNLLLSTVPEYASRTSGRTAAAGIVTGVLMAATVAVQPAVPRLLARLGYRTALITSMVLLGAPALVLGVSDQFATTVICSVLRGLGFGVFVVAGSAAVAELSPPGRRSQGVGWYGVATGFGGMVGTPFGVLLAHEFGYGPLFAVGAAAPAVGILGALAVTPPRPAPVVRPRVLAGATRSTILRPLLLLTTGTMASGAVVTFLPLAAPRQPVWLTPIALLLVQSGLTGSRYLSGRLGDRFGDQRLLLPSALMTAVGVLGGMLTDTPAALLPLMAVFGMGVGATQNATLALMLHRAGRAELSVASARWNLAFDVGLGLGGFSIGLIAQYTSPATGFAVVSAALVLASALAVTETKGPSPSEETAPQARSGRLREAVRTPARRAARDRRP